VRYERVKAKRSVQIASNTLLVPSGAVKIQAVVIKPKHA